MGQRIQTMERKPGQTLNHGVAGGKSERKPLSVGTTASTHEIPAIPELTAQELRGKIASFAELSEAEEGTVDEELNHDDER